MQEVKYATSVGGILGGCCRFIDTNIYGSPFCCSSGYTYGFHVPKPMLPVRQPVAPVVQPTIAISAALQQHIDAMLQKALNMWLPPVSRRGHSPAVTTGTYPVFMAPLLVTIPLTTQPVYVSLQ